MTTIINIIISIQQQYTNFIQKETWKKRIEQDGPSLESSSYLNMTLRYLGPWDPLTFRPWDLWTLGLSTF